MKLENMAARGAAGKNRGLAIVRIIAAAASVVAALDCAAATFAHTIYGGGYTCRNVATLEKAEFDAVTNLCPLAIAAYPEKYDAFSADVLRGMGYEEISGDGMRELLKGAPALTVGVENGRATVMRASDDGADNSLQARMFRNIETGDVVVSFRGSQESVDWKDDAQQIAMMGLPQQYSDASSLVRSVLANTSSRVVVVGHSLGGGLTQYAIASNDCGGRVRGYTYNSAGLSSRTVDEIEKARPACAEYAAAHVTGVRSRMDPVSFVGFHYGEMYDVTATEAARNARTAHGGDSIAEGLAKTVHGVVVDAAKLLSVQEVREILSLYDDPAVLARIEGDLHIVIADVYGAAAGAVSTAGAAADAATDAVKGAATRIIQFGGGGDGAKEKGE